MENYYFKKMKVRWLLVWVVLSFITITFLNVGKLIVFVILLPVSIILLSRLYKKVINKYLIFLMFNNPYSIKGRDASIRRSLFPYSRNGICILQ